MHNSSPSPGYPETLTLTFRTPVERLLVERALVMAQELEAASELAEPGLPRYSRTSGTNSPEVFGKICRIL